MGKKAKLLGIFLVILIGGMSASGIVHADVDWTIISDIDIGAQPLDVAATLDGKLIFILAPGEILVHAVSKNKITSRIPVPGDFDKLTYSANNDTLILTSSTLKKLKIIRVDRVHEIDISGLPFDGPEGAPVLIAAFDDYQ